MIKAVGYTPRRQSTASISLMMHSFPWTSQVSGLWQYGHSRP